MRNENFLPVIFSEASVRETNRPVRGIGPRAFAAVRHGIRSGKRDPRVSAAGRPTRQDRTGQDWTKQNKTGQGKTRQDKTRQNKTKHDTNEAAPESDRKECSSAACPFRSDSLFATSSGCSVPAKTNEIRFYAGLSVSLTRP